MKILDLTLPTPPHNLACDEALMDLCEEGFAHEILRFWEPLEHFVVLGYSNKIQSEINELSCQALSIPVVRRCSGGGTVLQGPGCLNFSLILDIENLPLLKSITQTNTYIMTRHEEALRPLLGDAVKVCGTTDLALGLLKFSGNAQRRKKRFLLFHGTFLHSFDISLVSKLLHFPTKQPPYRKNRSHTDFLTNVKVSPKKIREALSRCWDAREILEEVPTERIEKLVREKYSKEEWNRKF